MGLFCDVFTTSFNRINCPPPPARRCTHVMHGPSRMTIDPRIPTMPGRSTSGFHRPGRHCLHQARSAVRCSASRMKGELHPTKSRLFGGFPCKWMTASGELICYLVWSLPETAMGLLCNCLVGALPYIPGTHYMIRAFPSCGVKVLQPAQI